MYFWGYSLLTKTFAKIVIERYPDLDISFLDNDIKKQQNENVISVECLRKIQKPKVFIFSEHAKAMKNQISKMGFKENEDFFVLLDIEEWWEKQKNKFIQDNKKFRQIDMNEQRIIMLSILSEIHKICLEYNLKYTLSSGSLIGAVRHQGFIPWDHDLDICMPLPDMYKLQNIVEKRKDIKFQFFDTDSNYLYMSPRIVIPSLVSLERICGNNALITEFGIDVFPLGGFGKTASQRDEYIQYQYQIWQKWQDYYVMFNGKKNEQLIGDVLKFQSYYDYDDSLYVGPVNGTDIDFFGLKKEDFFPSKLMTFENLQVCVPNNWDLRLRVEYGDYMKVPSEKDIEASYNQQRLVYSLD